MGCCQSDESREVITDPLITLGADKKAAIEQMLTKYESSLCPTSFNITSHKAYADGTEEWMLDLLFSKKYSSTISYKNYGWRREVNLRIWKDDSDVIIAYIYFDDEVITSFYHSRWNDGISDKDLYSFVIHCLTCCCQGALPTEQCLKVWQSRANWIGEHHEKYREESKKNGFTDIEGVNLTIRANNRRFTR
jgi:hypothetical protein